MQRGPRIRWPRCITSCTLRSVSIDVSGLPRTAMISAVFPGVTVPTRSDTPIATDGQNVAARIVSIGSMP